MAPLACEYEFATAADVQPEVLHLGGNTPGWIEATPELHRAVGASDSNALKAALKGKVPIDTKDLAGNTALHVAASVGNKVGSELGRKDLGKLACIELLLQHGASVGMAGQWGQTPLHCATLQNLPEAVQMLLSAGADVSAQDEFGQTALHVAACGAPETLARLLKADGAAVALKLKDKENRTPLECARRHHATSDMVVFNLRCVSLLEGKTEISAEELVQQQAREARTSAS
uniref:Uncharacterized protein n=1 Tax=Chrysotila carterae TaxID=13221 RepID=A0A7S4F3I6_CHRCT